MSSINFKQNLTLPDFLKEDTPLCAETDPELFFPAEDEEKFDLKETRYKYKNAVEICKKCPYIFSCLEYALVNGEDYGVWGGTTPRERQFLRRSRGIRLPLNVKKPR